MNSIAPTKFAKATVVNGTVAKDTVAKDTVAEAPIDRDLHWYARLELQFQQTARACRLSRSRHQGPLYVQKPFYPEGRDLAHVYLLHPPGGLVSGDCLQIDVEVDESARALITTPGAGRVYRARKDRALQQQNIHLRVAAGASLEWLPLETIVYRGANARLNTHIELSDNSHFIGWEITSLGLPASGSAFDKGELRQGLKIVRDGEPLLIESLLLSDATRAFFSASAGLRGCPITGLFVAGPFQSEQVTEDMMAECRAALASDNPQALTAISQVGEFLVARYIGHCSEETRKLFTGIWSLIRPELLGRTACPPRIWAT